MRVCCIKIRCLFPFVNATTKNIGKRKKIVCVMLHIVISKLTAIWHLTFSKSTNATAILKIWTNFSFQWSVCTCKTNQAFSYVYIDDHDSLTSLQCVNWRFQIKCKIDNGILFYWHLFEVQKEEIREADCFVENVLLSQSRPSFSSIRLFSFQFTTFLCVLCALYLAIGI